MRCGFKPIHALFQLFGIDRLCRNDDPCRAQKAPIERVTLLNHGQNRTRLGVGRWLHRHGFVKLRIERLALRIHLDDAETLKSSAQQLQCRLAASHNALDIGGIGCIGGR